MFGLYIHWPFCRAKCPYCDFNSHVRESIDEDHWRRALLTELDFVGQETRGRTLTSVFFGGGTPSLMSPRTVSDLLDKLSQYWILSSQLEITLEANPNSVEIEKFRDFKKAGVNRLSLGIQALEDKALKFLGRVHNQAEAVKAIEIARQVFERYSFDLIYARPGQTLMEWRQELTQALKLSAQHLSVYQLTIEPGTAFYTAHQRGDWQIPDEELAAQFYEETQDILESYGLPAYEVSNHAQAGFECQHNLTYWQYHDYTCIGPGAHGRLTLQDQRYAVKNYRAPETWLKQIDQTGHGRQTKESLLPREQLIECLMMGLRLKEGISLRRLTELTKKALADIFSQQALDDLYTEGYLDAFSERLQLTPAGLQRLNSILEFLIHKIKIY